MDKVKIETTIEEIVFPIINGLGYEFIDVEYVKENREWYLRIYIDNETGITLDDCTKVSRVISDKLDEIDPIEDSYYLEVSSPGLNRPLKKERDFEKSIGKKIVIKYPRPIDGQKKIEGVLKKFENDKITLDVNGLEKIIDKKLASKIRLNE